MAPKRGRFDYDAIVHRVEDARVSSGRSTRELATTAGIPGPSWYRKLRNRGSTFTLDEFGRIADALDAPEGWPFVDWRK